MLSEESFLPLRNTIWHATFDAFVDACCRLVDRAINEYMMGFLHSTVFQYIHHIFDVILDTDHYFISNFMHYCHYTGDGDGRAGRAPEQGQICMLFIVYMHVVAADLKCVTDLQ